jgi:hypothetical protein
VSLDAAGLPLEALGLATNGIAAGETCIAVLPPEKISLLKNA